MSLKTARFGFPLLQTAQAQKEVTHNAALHAVDRWLSRRVESRRLSEPPATPAIGQAWIAAPGSSGAWSAKDGMIAEWDGAGWMFAEAPPGMLVWTVDENQLVLRDMVGWADNLPVHGLEVRGRSVLAADPATIAEPEGGEVVDLEARLAISQILENLQSQGFLT